MNKEILCKCLLECKDEILVFTNFTSLVLISAMIAPVVILFIIKLYAQNNTFKTYLEKQFNIEPPKVSDTIKFNYFKLPYVGQFSKTTKQK